MSVEAVIAATLKAIPALSGRPVRPDKVEEEDLPPYVIFQNTFGTRVSDLGGDAGLANLHFQIDVFATTRAEAIALREAIRIAILANPQLNAVHTHQSASYEEAVRLYRELTDFSVWFYG